jgi:hypothetical protein
VPEAKITTAGQRPGTACSKADRAVSAALDDIAGVMPPGTFCIVHTDAIEGILRRLYGAGADDMTAAAIAAVESALCGHEPAQEPGVPAYLRDIPGCTWCEIHEVHHMAPDYSPPGGHWCPQCQGKGWRRP